DPWLATSIGFALSVAATLGILLWAGPISELLGSTLLSRAVAVPLAAQAWCAPLLLTFEATLATYSVPANLLAVPALAPATILGLVSALLSSLAPGAAALAASLASYFTGWIAAVAVFFAGLPGAKIPWPGGPLGGGALITFTLGAAAGRRRGGGRSTCQAQNMPPKKKPRNVDAMPLAPVTLLKGSEGYFVDAATDKLRELALQRDPDVEIIWVDASV